MPPPVQPLRLLDDVLVVERGTAAPPAGDDWVAVVRAPDGVTVVRRVRAGEPADEPWRAFHGEAGHDLDLPGMLLAVIRPLGEAGVPVFVTSTFDADLVLVPAGRVDEAAGLLADAGHEVRR
ncbi:ACT domain-containing protein [Patulibacter minatonensis]|uniref:ACT domain-containing protein n=1 Tax=Patulibacter minatonensis TaxID=298163 RepID=UPI00047EAC22|nr:ACT domain-containing protein [Patulibacter minatonensis]